MTKKGKQIKKKETEQKIERDSIEVISKSISEHKNWFLVSRKLAFHSMPILVGMLRDVFSAAAVDKLKGFLFFSFFSFFSFLSFFSLFSSLSLELVFPF